MDLTAISNCLTIAWEIYKLFEDVHQKPHELILFITRLQKISNILQGANNVNKKSNLAIDLINELNNYISPLSHELDKIYIKLNEHRKRITHFIEYKKIVKILENQTFLVECISDFQLMLDVENWANIKDLIDRVKEIRFLMNNHIDNESKNESDDLDFKQAMELKLADQAKNKSEDIIEMLKLSATNGNANAMYQLGWMNEYVKDDYARAFYWYSRAADKDHPCAHTALGCMSINGKGFGRNEKLALDLLRKDENKNPFGNLALGIIHWEGIGTSEDTDKAIEFYKKAAIQAQQSSKAIENVKSLVNVNLGVIYNNKKESEKAKAYFKQGKGPDFENLKFGRSEKEALVARAIVSKLV